MSNTFLPAGASKPSCSGPGSPRPSILLCPLASHCNGESLEIYLLFSLFASVTPGTRESAGSKLPVGPIYTSLRCCTRIP